MICGYLCHMMVMIYPVRHLVVFALHMEKEVELAVVLFGIPHMCNKLVN